MYPPDMKLIETLTEEELVREIGRRAKAAGGGCLVCVLAEPKGTPEAQTDRIYWSGGRVQAMGMAMNAIDRLRIYGGPAETS